MRYFDYDLRMAMLMILSGKMPHFWSIMAYLRVRGKP
jgi:hypothetical protein